jgi:phosphate transporter
MCVPLMLIMTGILNDEFTNKPMPAKDAASYISGKMFAPVILLLLGGFSIAAAVSKEHVAKRMATFILSRAGTRSSNILLAIMCVATFASMWLSNVAAPVLCFSVIEPLLRTLEPGNGFAKSLIMGIALACKYLIHFLRF